MSLLDKRDAKLLSKTLTTNLLFLLMTGLSYFATKAGESLLGTIIQWIARVYFAVDIIFSFVEYYKDGKADKKKFTKIHVPFTIIHVSKKMTGKVAVKQESPNP